MSNRIYFVVVLLVGLAILLPLSQHFGGPVLSSGVEIAQVKTTGGQAVIVTGLMQPDAMARMSFKWMDVQATPAKELSEKIFFAMAKPYGPGGKTPEFVAYETADGKLVGIAQQSLADEVLIFLNRETGETWPSLADLAELGRGEREGVVVDVITQPTAWLARLRQEHPQLKADLIAPPKRELVPPLASEVQP